MKGQVSTELMVVVAVVLAIFIPLMTLVYFKASEANEQIGSNQAELAVFRLAYLANSVGSLGTNTTVTTDVYIPPNVVGIETRSIGKGGEIIFTVLGSEGESEIVEIVRYPVNNAQFKSVQGWARFTITSDYDPIKNEASITITSSRD